jgi:hypothetical protein
MMVVEVGYRQSSYMRLLGLLDSETAHAGGNVNDLVMGSLGGSLVATIIEAKEKSRDSCYFSVDGQSHSNVGWRNAIS